MNRMCVLLLCKRKICKISILTSHHYCRHWIKILPSRRRQQQQQKRKIAKSARRARFPISSTHNSVQMNAKHWCSIQIQRVNQKRNYSRFARREGEEKTLWKINSIWFALIRMPPPDSTRPRETVKGRERGRKREQKSIWLNINEYLRVLLLYCTDADVISLAIVFIYTQHHSDLRQFEESFESIPAAARLRKFREKEKKNSSTWLPLTSWLDSWNGTNSEYMQMKHEIALNEFPMSRMPALNNVFRTKGKSKRKTAHRIKC